MGVNLTETLKGIPGLQLNNRENYADLQLFMRGFGARSTFGVRGIVCMWMVFSNHARWTRSDVKY
jgi:hypothetical protein